MSRNKEIYDIEQELSWLESKCTFDALSKVDMHDGQPAILTYIYLHPNCTQYEVARYLGLSRATIGVSVKRMVKSGWIRVKDSDKDKRATCLNITKQGTRCLVKSDMIMNNLVTRKYEGFSIEELNAYMKYLKMVKKNLIKMYRETKSD